MAEYKSYITQALVKAYICEPRKAQQSWRAVSIQPSLPFWKTPTSANIGKTKELIKISTLKDRYGLRTWGRSHGFVVFIRLISKRFPLCANHWSTCFWNGVNLFLKCTLNTLQIFHFLFFKKYFDCNHFPHEYLNQITLWVPRMPWKQSTNLSHQLLSFGDLLKHSLRQDFPDVRHCNMPGVWMGQCNPQDGMSGKW